MRLIVLFVWLFALSAATGGTLTKPDLVKRFPAPLQVGDKDPEIAAWPIFKQNATATELVGYVFESIDLAPIPGFAGVPMNMLVAIDPKGSFIDVAVLSHHEPVFLDGLGEAPLFAFADQYKGLSLKQNIHIDSKTKRLRASDAANAYLDGVSKATASVRILNQSVLSAALKVARKKLGFALGRDPERIARIRTEFFEELSVGEMLDAGLIKRVRLLNRDVEALFAGTAGEGIDSGVPGDVFIDLYLAHVSVPSVGRNLLTEASWNKLRNRLDDGDHAVLVMSSGRYGVIGDDFVRGSVTDRIVLKQGGLPIDMRDLDLDMRLAHAGPLPTQSVTVFRIIGQAGLDAASAQAYALPITRLKGIVYPERITKEINFTYQLPAAYYVASAASDTAWPGIWKERKVELLVLATALAVLSIALAMPKRLTRDGARFGRFRILFLLFTVGFIGYYAQGQLSIVNLTGSIQALLAGRSLEFFLYDPMTVILWGFVLVSLLAWGRGTFCGWLCPFGALQELTGKLGQALRFPQLMIRTAVNGRLKNLQYAVLALILGSAVFAPAMTDMLVELEPFKTAITLNFVRSWPFVAYALALLVMSMFSYKFFCRYLCPFGAALALLGRFRILDWIPRRKECGAPCQSCRYSCEYQAITPAGGVSYDECFQCMDCVVIHESEDKCVPLIFEKKRRHSIPIIQGSA